jgi:hypothetical protein
MAALGQGPTDFEFYPVGAHTQRNDLSTAQILAPADVAGATGATKLMIQAQTQNVRLTLGGTTPTASKGLQLKAGDPAVQISITSATVITVIQETATAVIDFQWGK